MKKRKKPIAFLLAAVMVFTMAACSSADSAGTPSASPPEEVMEPAGDETPPAGESSTAEESPGADVGEGEIIVFAAASMTETLGEIKTTYENDHPGITITYNFDSSGTLKTQIEEGASCDLFISAGQKQMDQLDINADPSVNTGGLDFVNADSRIDLLENRVTLCVPADNPKNINSFDGLAAAFESGDVLLCMGNSDVPVGQYTQKILTWYGLDEEALAGGGMITYGSNVKEVTTQINESAVDCGVIYCTDAFSAGLTIVDYATAEMCGQVIYPAAVLKTAQNPTAAQAFLDYLTTDEAMQVFEAVGFSPA